ncbi:DUF4401 domain-containing protein [Myxococcota bacterium]|nr:DUF4401 domain-containing protein [Myxococcota bacterium]
MRRPSLRAIWPEGLDEAAAIKALEAHAEASEASPWPIQLLVGGGAWLSALLLMVFALMILDGQEGAQLLGALAIAVGIGLRRRVEARRVFLTQLTLSLSLAGHALVIGPLNDTSLIAPLATIALGALSLLTFPDPVHRFLSTLLMALGAVWLVHDLIEAPWALELLGVLIAAGLTATFEWEVAWQRSRAAALHLPIGFGLAAALALLSLPSIQGQPGHDLMGGTAGLCLVLAVAAWRAAQEAGVTLRGWRAVVLIAATLLPLLVAPQAPGVVGAALVIVLGLRRAHPALFYGAIGFGLVFLYGWYAQLELPLMQKAGALVGLGVGILALRLTLLRASEAQ